MNSHRDPSSDKNSTSSRNILLNQIRQEFRDELKKCTDQNRKEQEKLKMEMQDLEIYLLTMKRGGILKVIICLPPASKTFI